MLFLGTISILTACSSDSSAESGPKKYNQGEEVDVYPYAYVVTEVIYPYSAASPDSPSDPNMRLLKVILKVRSLAENPLQQESFFRLKDSEGNLFYSKTMPAKGDYLLVESPYGPNFTARKLKPGQEMLGSIVFEVPKNSTLTELLINNISMNEKVINISGVTKDQNKTTTSNIGVSNGSNDSNQPNTQTTIATVQDAWIVNQKAELVEGPFNDHLYSITVRKDKPSSQVCLERVMTDVDGEWPPGYPEEPSTGCGGSTAAETENPDGTTTYEQTLWVQKGLTASGQPYQNQRFRYRYHLVNKYGQIYMTSSEFCYPDLPC